MMTYKTARTFFWGLLALGPFLGTGCGIPQAITDASEKIDNMINAVDRADHTIKTESRDWRTESQQWRASLKELEETFTKNGEALLGRELRNTADHAISHLSGETRADIDYLELCIKGNLRVVKMALQDARDKVEKAKERHDSHVLPDIFKTIGETKVWHDPAIVSFVPNHVVMRVNGSDSSKFSVTDGQRIEANGWGFDRPAGEQLNLSLDVVNAKGVIKKLATATILKTSNYQLQVMLDPQGNGFVRDDKKLVFVCGDGPNNRRELAILWDLTDVENEEARRRAEAEKLRKEAEENAKREFVTKIRIEYHTLSDDKDEEDSVQHSIVANNVELSSGEYSKGEVWPDWKGPFPARRTRIGPFLAYDFGHPEDRTFALSQPVELGKNVGGRFTVTKKPTNKGWDFRVEVYGITNKGRTLRYDNNWRDFFKNGRQSHTWDFNWGN
jgi:hypothetical protein